MKSPLLLLALLVACPAPEGDPKLEDTGSADTGLEEETDTDLSPETDEPDEEDADWGGGACDYTVTSVAADEWVEYLGGTPAEFAALVSGTRSTTIDFDADAVDTTLDHTLVVDASTAQLWRGVWIDREDDGGETTDEDDVRDSGGGATEEDGGGSSGSDGGSEGPPAPDPDEDTGAVEPDEPTDTGVVHPDTGAWGGDTGDEGVRCPDYLTAEAQWTFATGDGSFDEALHVTVRAQSLPVARITHVLDVSALVGTFVPPVEDPAGWDELRVELDGVVGAEIDVGNVKMFGSRTWSGGDDTSDGTDTTDGGGTSDGEETSEDEEASDAEDTSDEPDETDVAEAFMMDVARWPAPDVD